MEFWPEGLLSGGHNPVSFLKKLRALGFELEVMDEIGSGYGNLSPELKSKLGELGLPFDDWIYCDLVCTKY